MTLTIRTTESRAQMNEEFIQSLLQVKFKSVESFLFQTVTWRSMLVFILAVCARVNELKTGE